MTGTSDSADPINAETVRQLFETCWPNKARYPEDRYYGIAIAMQVIRDRRPPPAPAIPPAITYARQFLHNSPELRSRLEAEQSGYVTYKWGANDTPSFLDQARFERCTTALAALAEAEAAMARALDAWTDRDPLYIRDGDPAKFLRNCVQAAWGSLGDKEIPRSQNEDAPLCHFIADALDKARIRVGQGKTKGGRYTPAAISAVLTKKTERLNFIRLPEGDNSHS